MTTYNEPADWARGAAESLAIGLDIAALQDHSFLTAGGVWSVGGRPTIGVFQIKQWAQGTPLDAVAAEAAAYAKEYRAKILVDLSNNAAFASLLAGHFSNAADHICGASITQAAEHASIPTRLQLAVGGQHTAIPKWSLSKAQMMHELAAEIDNRTLRTSKVGDWQALAADMATFDQHMRASGSLSLGAQSGKHDDGVASLALLVFALRRLGGVARRRVTPKRAGFSSRAWT